MFYWTLAFILTKLVCWLQKKLGLPKQHVCTSVLRIRVSQCSLRSFRDLVSKRTSEEKQRFKSVCPTVLSYGKLSGCKNKTQESTGLWGQYQETSCCRNELCHLWHYTYFLPKNIMNSDNLNQIILSDNNCELEFYLVGNMVGKELSFVMHLKWDYSGDYWLSVGALEKRLH